jgi:hypothetical protein
LHGEGFLYSIGGIAQAAAASPQRPAGTRLEPIRVERIRRGEASMPDMPVRMS